MRDAAAARLARAGLLKGALDVIHEEAPEHAPEAHALARQYLSVVRRDDRLGPDQGQRVRAVVAIAARATGDASGSVPVTV